MKILFSPIILLLFPLSRAFAHEEGLEITNLAEADWVGPLVAVLIIVGAIIVARVVRIKIASSANRSSKQIKIDTHD